MKKYPTLYRTDIKFNNKPIFFYASKMGSWPVAGAHMRVFFDKLKVRFFPSYQEDGQFWGVPANAFQKYSPEQMPPMVWPHYPIGDTVVSVPPCNQAASAGMPYAVRFATEVGEVGIPALDANGKTYLVRPGELFLVLPVFAFFVWTGGQSYGQWTPIERGSVYDAIVASWEEIEYANEILQASGQSIVIDEWKYINTFCAPNTGNNCPPYYGTTGYGCWCGGGTYALSIYIRHVLAPAQYFNNSVSLVNLPPGIMVFASPESRDPVHYSNLPLPYNGATPPEEELYVYVAARGTITYDIYYGYNVYCSDCWAVSCGMPPEDKTQLTYCLACEEEGGGKRFLYAEWSATKYTGLLSLNEYLEYLNDRYGFGKNILEAGDLPTPPDPDNCYNFGPCWW